jgi:hypothetical protein
VLREAAVDDSRVVGAIGALAPRPPGYAEPLHELIQRLAAEPQLARGLPRLAEEYLARKLYGGEIAGREPEAARLLRLLVVFIQRQGRLPVELVEPLRRRPGAEGESESDGSSGDAATAAEPAADAREDGAAEAAEPRLFREQT